MNYHLHKSEGLQGSLRKPMLTAILDFYLTCDYAPYTAQSYVEGFTSEQFLTQPIIPQRTWR